MMISINKVILLGQLAKDPYTTTSRDGGAITYVTIKTDRSAQQDGTKGADYTDCVSFGKTADFITENFKAGDLIAAEGKTRTTSYVKDGVKQYRQYVHILAAKKAAGDPEPEERGNNDENARTFTADDFPGLNQPEGPRVYFAGYRQYD